MDAPAGELPPPRLPSTELPPPPPPGAPHRREDTEARHGSPESGQLTPAWRGITGVAWGLTFVAMIAVWKTSRELGLATWWLGPPGDPAPWPVAALPFLPSAAIVALVVHNSRWVPWAGLAGAVWIGVVGALDLDRVWRLGVVELGIAGAAAAVAVAGFGNRYR